MDPENTNSSEPWHTETAEQVTNSLDTDVQRGIASTEAACRLAKYGPNTIEERGARSALQVFAAQFRDFSVLILVAAAVIAGFVGDLKDAIAIAVIVAINGVIATSQEIRAQRAIGALRKLAAEGATVVRDGSKHLVDAKSLVPGDVVIIEAGDKVPADLRLAETAQLRIAEAALTGESVPVDKHTRPLRASSLALGDRANMAFKGTNVSGGRGRGIVVATGMNTEIGKIAGMLDTGVEVLTPLQQRLYHFARRLSLIIIGICAIILAVGLIRGEPIGIMFLTAISLAVAAVPEALPATVVIALALGARKMVEHKALIRRLPAVEALGSVTFICTDKTGTLTQDRMHVEELRDASGALCNNIIAPVAEPWSSLLTALALNNDVSAHRGKEPIGDATEIAIWRFASDAGFKKADLERDSPRVLDFPFDSERKRMTTLHAEGDGFIAYCKGAPEAIVDRCTQSASAGGQAKIDRAKALDIASAIASQGLRVLAVARRRWRERPSEPTIEGIERSMTLMGFVGLIDPPRDEAAQSVAACKIAGITPVMITGDHPDTAQAIASRLGILVGERGHLVVVGNELSKLSDDELAARIPDIRVYARADPAQKIRIVAALQARGEFVAMTGDGVNDAPALQRANVGVAMGRSGTDVAREAASLVLMDDNFATIVAAVREGRRIFDNVRKFIKFLLAGNSAEIWTMFLAPLMGLPTPLLPIHILWINLVTDGLPALALAAEPAERDIMERKPRPPSEGILAGGLWQHVVWVGLLIAGLSLFAQAFAFHSGSSHWQTMVFTVLTLSQLAHVLAIRSVRSSLFHQGLLSNPPIIGAVVFTVLLQMAVIYAPPLNDVFNTAPLAPGELAICFALSLVTFFAVELEKVLVRRGLLERS